ncbi:MAG: transcriptional regulator [Pseudomonadales bacterium]|jgi:predicted ArsR family transcriptional regulator|nr:transcriptional regulator [Pseudomonadales bacterium]
MANDTSGSQDKILYQIKRLGPQSAKDLSINLGMTTMGIRQHMATLEEQSLVKTTPPEPQKRGRPVARWQLTDEGHARFPDAHAQMTVELIASVRDLLGEQALDKVITDRAEKTEQIYAEALETRSTLAAKVTELARLRTAEGYMAEAERLDDGSFRLAENHCPICIAATSCQGFCRTELQTFQTLFEGTAEVKREEYLLEGARRCTYLITPVS